MQEMRQHCAQQQGVQKHRTFHQVKPRPTPSMATRLFCSLVSQCCTMQNVFKCFVRLVVASCIGTGKVRSLLQAWSQKLGGFKDTATPVGALDGAEPTTLVVDHLLAAAPEEVHETFAQQCSQNRTHEGMERCRTNLKLRTYFLKSCRARCKA